MILYTISRTVRSGNMYKVLSQLRTTKCIQYAYDCKEFPFNILKKEIVSKGKHKKYHKIPMTFDIETSKIPKDTEGGYEAFMYIWQICIEGNVVFGRTWEQWVEFMKHVADAYKLCEDEKIVVYVHNLSFEFQFIQKFMNFEDVFAMESRSILTCKTSNFEFRCSYKLSNMNLAKFIKDTPNTMHYKGVGDLDYETVRTPKTQLTDVELGYCYNDVMGLWEAVMQLLKDDNLATIPLTSTGYVRRDCRNAMRKNKKFRQNFLKQKFDLPTFHLLRECFRGGNTASSRFLVNEIIENVGSWDIASSYPFQMISKKYPMSGWSYGTVVSIEELEALNKKYCTIARYTFKNLRLKKTVPIAYIPLSKCNGYSEKRTVYNGRILDAEFIEISLTNIDYDIIKSQYYYDDIAIDELHYCYKDYLPKELRDEIMHYYYLKSTLKGNKEKHYEYMKAKNKLNSIYGMCVTNILHQEVEFDNGDYTVKTMTPEEEQEALDKYFKSKNSFLNYSWGVFVTAYARKELQDMLDTVGADVIYCDTDSVKYQCNHDNDFEDYNEKLLKYCKDNNIVNYAEVNGKKYYIGLFDKEESYDNFITLGAKKYAYEQDGKIGITVSGLSKKQGGEELKRKGGLKKFAKGEIFYNSGRTIAQYNNDDIHQLTVDGCTFTTASNMAIVDSTYTLGITDTMLEIIERVREEMKDEKKINKQ